MPSRLFDAYRAFHEQAFVPIFCQDRFDSRRQVEACVAAGCTGIEYTLRKPDAREMIPWVRKNYPDLYLLVGSTIDNEDIVTRMRAKYPQLMTVAEIADMDVDGFVSMINWSQESISKYAPTHIVCPTAMTVGEALAQTAAGAHFQKLAGSDIDFVRRCRCAAAFGYCPIFVTGGQTPEIIMDSFQAGAVMVGAGFDLMLRKEDDDINSHDMATILARSLKAATDARHKVWPKLAAAAHGPKDMWLKALPHWHPF